MNLSGSSARRRARLGAGLAAAAVMTAGLGAMPQTAQAVQSNLFVTQAAAAAPAPVVTSAATWKYLENDTFPSGADPDALSWTKAGFDDTAWKSGVGPFGGKVSDGTQSPDYSSSNVAKTQLEMNAPGGSERVRTYFFRTDFTVTAEQIAALDVVRGQVGSDDGIMVYVNGREVLRNDVPEGSEGLNYASGSTTSLDSSDFEFDADLLVAGVNTVAVSVHNDRPTSSDIWFDLAHLTPLTATEARNKPSRVILTPTEDPYTSQYVTFQGADAGDTKGRVQIKPAAGGPVRQVNAPIQPKSISNDFGHFSATVTGLEPATEYTYRVSSDGKWSDWHTFSSADRSEKEFSYLYYGDAQIGLDSTWPKVVDAATAKAPEAIGSVHAGDLIDSSSNDTQWKNWFSGMETAAATTNVMAAPGNHEYSGDKLMTAWKAHFEYPLNNPNDSTIGDLANLAVGNTPEAKQYRAYFDHWADFAAETVYFNDYQGARFITVNATRDSTFLRPDVLPPCGSADCPSTKVADLWTAYQAQWLDHVLEHSEAKWNVVTFHQPVYSTSSGRNEPVLREHWVPVFEKHNIDLVQMGHDHTYARGYKDTTATDTPGVTNGPVYIVSNSGAKHYKLESDEKNVWTSNGATQVLKAANLTTYQVIDVAEDKLTYRSYIAEIAGEGLFYKNGEQVDASNFKVGDLWDEFTVHKSDHGQKAVVEAGMVAPEFEDLSAPPVLTTDLAAETPVKPGDRVTLDIAADGGEKGEELSLQWQSRSADGEWIDLVGETRPTLKLGRVTVGDFGTAYRALVTSGTKSVTSTETVLVDATPEVTFVTDLPAKVQVLSGNDAALRVETDGDASVRYQWQIREGGEWADLEGRTGASLVLENVRTSGREYRVVATSGTRTATSASTVVEMSQRAFEGITSDLPAETLAKPGERVAFNIVVDGGDNLSVQWQSRVGNGAWLDLAGETGTSLRLGRVGIDDFGTAYRAVVTDGIRSVTSTESVLVDATAEITFTTNLPANVKVTSGKDLTLRVKGETDAEVRYQWQRLVGGAWVDLEGRTGSTLTLQKVRTSEQYRAVAKAATREAVSTVTTVEVTKRATKVKIAKTTLKAGKKPVIKVRGSVAGTIKVTIKQGKKTWTKTVAVRKSRTTTVRFPQALTKRSNARVVAVLTPHSADHKVAKVTKGKVKVRR